MPHIGELDPRLATVIAVTPTVGSSPWTYTAGRRGMVSINGGSVSIVTYARGADFAFMPVSGGLMVMQGDTVTITYLVAPTVKFFPWAQ